MFKPSLLPFRRSPATLNYITIYDDIQKCRSQQGSRRSSFNVPTPGRWLTDSDLSLAALPSDTDDILGGQDNKLLMLLDESKALAGKLIAATSGAKNNLASDRVTAMDDSSKD